MTEDEKPAKKEVPSSKIVSRVKKVKTRGQKSSDITDSSSVDVKTAKEVKSLSTKSTSVANLVTAKITNH